MLTVGTYLRQWVDLFVGQRVDSIAAVVYGPPLVPIVVPNVDMLAA